MYCPKCEENFDEGSRRFCPTDGARLISGSAGAVNDAGPGIFANLIPKIAGANSVPGSDTSPLVLLEPIGRPAETRGNDDIFFDLDDDGPPNARGGSIPPPTVPVDGGRFAASAAASEIATRVFEAPAAKPAVRKVNPDEIPKGHVVLSTPKSEPIFSVNVDEEDPDSFVGRMVKGRYKVTEFLGDDETGLAYLADDKLVEDKKVLVRILVDGESDAIMDSILAEERVSLSHFSHPNVARLIDSGQFTNGASFLISEYVEALSIGDILSIHGFFPAERTARAIRQAGNALNEAHQEGIIHRDVRPDNLIVTPSEMDVEHTRLVNFGVSNGEPTVQNLVYKAPEVLDGRIPTTGSDIYSLAVTAFEMLTGQLPFAGTKPKDIVKSQYAGMTLLPSDVRPELPRAVNKVLAKALSYNASERYPRARDFGDAFYAAASEPKVEPLIPIAETGVEKAIIPIPQDFETRITPYSQTFETRIEPPRQNFETRIETFSPEIETRVAQKPLTPKPLATPAAARPVSTEKPRTATPAWKNRSSEPPLAERKRPRGVLLFGVAVLLSVAAFGVWYLLSHRPVPERPVETVQPSLRPSVELPVTAPPENTEMPPHPRVIAQPQNTNFYQNSKQNLKGDLLLNFVGFTMYYPKDWKFNAPQPGALPSVRGKFVDISKSTADGRLKEQMLVSYYPSKGTFTTDADKFPQMTKETNETLKKLLPNYKTISEGEIKINGEWRAYEVKFQGGGTSASGEKLIVYGRRLFIPAARPGIRNGFEITMLATSLADGVHSAGDVGEKGQLASVLETFEPSQNF